MNAVLSPVLRAPIFKEDALQKLQKTHLEFDRGGGSRTRFDAFSQQLWTPGGFEARGHVISGEMYALLGPVFPFDAVAVGECAVVADTCTSVRIGLSCSQLVEWRERSPMRAEVCFLLSVPRGTFAIPWQQIDVAKGCAKVGVQVNCIKSPCKSVQEFALGDYDWRGSHPGQDLDQPRNAWLTVRVSSR